MFSPISCLMMVGWMYFLDRPVDHLIGNPAAPHPDFTTDDVDEARLISRFGNHAPIFYPEEINESLFPISTLTRMAYQFIYLTREGKLRFLSCLTPRGLRKFLGGILYPHVRALEPLHAPKVTGMILQLENTMIMNLLEVPDALTAKVAEAIEILTRHHMI
ncbi:hypothetical protein ACP275_08G105300 [Erythranthe tilingii]